MNNKGYKSNSAFLSTSPSSFHHQFGLFVDLFFCLLVLVGFFWGGGCLLLSVCCFVFFPGGKRGKSKQLTEPLNVSLT